MKSDIIETEDILLSYAESISLETTESSSENVLEPTSTQTVSGYVVRVRSYIRHVFASCPPALIPCFLSTWDMVTTPKYGLNRNTNAVHA